jgi:DNA repair protein RadA/Sms
MLNKVKRGRPSKIQVVKNQNNVSIKTVKMNDMSFNDDLFNPMPTKTKIDQFFSAEGGVMPGTLVAAVGDPGVGKTTVLLDVLADLQKQGKKVLFISGEMNAIDMVGYVRRYPKFGNLDILFMGDYLDANPEQVVRQALKPGYDVVLVDSMMEVADMIVGANGGTNKAANSMLLNMFEEQTRGLNDGNVNTAFLLIQQVTKSGGFAGSNKFKHMVTAMMHMKNSPEGRYIYFSKNRRGGNANRLFFSLDAKNRVNYLYEAPINE